VSALCVDSVEHRLGATIALHFMHYNFARIHQTLRVTPAMGAGLSDYVWSIEEIVRVMDYRFATLWYFGVAGFNLIPPSDPVGTWVSSEQFQIRVWTAVLYQ